MSNLYIYTFNATNQLLPGNPLGPLRLAPLLVDLGLVIGPLHAPGPLAHAQRQLELGQLQVLEVEHGPANTGGTVEKGLKMKRMVECSVVNSLGKDLATNLVPVDHIRDHRQLPLVLALRDVDDAADFDVFLINHFVLSFSTVINKLEVKVSSDDYEHRWWWCVLYYYG
jgi:hypothetical protein